MSNLSSKLPSNVILEITKHLGPENQKSLLVSSKTTKGIINKSRPGLLINLIDSNPHLCTESEKARIRDLVKKYDDGRVEDLENNFALNINEKKEQFKEIENKYYNLLKLLNSDIVLIMGGLVSDSGIWSEWADDIHSTNIVTKMIVEQDGNIIFDDGTPMLQARRNHDALYHKGEVFSISSDDDDARRTVECLDILTQAQTQLQIDLPNDVYNVCAAMLNNKLYVINYNRDVYTLEEGVWRKHEANTKQGRPAAAAISFEEKLYLCGGHGKRNIEVFDPTVGTWQLDGEEMIHKRSLFSLYVFDDEIYAVGGDDYDQNTTIEKRKKDTKQWENVTDCGQNRSGCTSVLVGSKIFLFGGREHKSTFDYFDLKSKKWASQDITSAYFDIGERQLPREIIESKAVFIPKRSLSGGSLLSSNYDLNQKLIKNKIKEINNKLLNFKGTLKKIKSKNIKYVKKDDSFMIKYSYVKK